MTPNNMLLCASQVKALAADSDATVATLSRLIGLLADGSVADLAAFMSSSGPVLASLSVDVEATLSAKRLVAIAALGGAHGTVTFADVAAAIQVSRELINCRLQSLLLASDYTRLLGLPRGGSNCANSSFLIPA